MVHGSRRQVRRCEGQNSGREAEWEKGKCTLPVLKNETRDFVLVVVKEASVSELTIKMEGSACPFYAPGFSGAQISKWCYWTN